MTAPAGGTAAAVWVSVLPDLSGFGRRLIDELGDAGQRGGQAAGERAESSLSKAAKGIAAVGAGIGAALGVALVGAISVEKANDKLAAQLGLSGARAKELGTIAGDLYSNAYGDSLEGVNDAIRGVIQSGLVMEDASNEQIQSITAKVLDLSAAFGVDLGGATEAVGQLMKTGLAPNADAALDVVTRGFQQGADRSGDFLDTLTEYSGQFQKFGLDAGTATGILTQGMNAGARNADLVADAIKEFSIRAVDGSKLTGEGFRALGLDGAEMARKIAAGGPEASGALDLVLDRLRAMPDPVQRSQAAVALFGTQAEDLGDALFALDPSSAVVALGRVEGAAAAMGATLNDNAATNLEAFKRQAISAFVDIVGGQVLPIVSGFALFLATTFGPALAAVGGFLTGTVVPAFQAFVGWLRDSQGWLLPLAAGLGTVALALNATRIATTIWLAVTAGASAVMALARGAALSFQIAVWLLNAAMLANPIGIVVVLLAGLVAAFVVAYNTSETFRNFVDKVWESFSTVAAPALEFLQALVVSVWETISTAFMQGVTVISGLWSGFWNTLGPLLSAAWNVVVTILQSAWNILTAVFTTALAFLRGDWDGFWNGLGSIVSAVWNAIGAIVGAGWELVKALFNSAAAFVAAIWGTMWAGLSGAAQAGWAIIQGLLQAGWALLQALFAAGVQFVTGMWSGFWNSLSSTATTVWNAIRGLIDTVWNAIVGLFSSNTASVSAGWSAFWSVVQTVATTVFNAIRAVIDVVWQVIKGLFTAAMALLRGDWTGFWTALQQVGTTMFNAIRAFIDLVWSQIRAGFTASTTFVQGMWQGFWNTLSTVASTVFNSIKRTIDTVIGGIIGAFRFVVDQVGAIWNGIRGMLARPINFMIGTVYNNGIVRAWNFVAGLLGIGGIQPIGLIPEFAAGGQVRGGGTTTSDSIPAMLSRDEHVWTAKEVRGAGGHEQVMALREAAENGTLRFYARGGAAIPGFAEGGAVWQGLFNLVKAQFPRANANSTVRPGDPGYHGRGKAVDLGEQGFSGGAGRPYLAAMNRWIHDTYGGNTAELIYSGLGDDRPDLKNGRPLNYGAATTAAHRNHVHWAADSVPGQGGPGGGGFFNFILDQVRRLYDGATGGLVAAIRGLVGNPPPRFREIPPAMAATAIKSVGDFLFGKAAAAGSGGTGIPAGREANVAAVQADANPRGWGSGRQWSDLVALINAESGFNNVAQNPTSTAYGMYQFLNSTWATVGGSKTSDPRLQALYGNRYIAQRYGDPSGAWAFHRRNNYYDSGGWMQPGFGSYFNGTGKPEAVLTNEQWTALTDRVRGGDDRSVVVNMEVNNPVAERGSDTAVRKLRTAAALGMFE